MAVAVVVASLSLPRFAEADLRIHVDGGGVAPMDKLLRDVGAGLGGGIAIDYEIVHLLSIGVFWNPSLFMRDLVDATCSPTEPAPEGCSCDRVGASADVVDHAAGVRLGLRFVRHNAAGWFGAVAGDLYGEGFFDLDLAYHNIGNEHRLGWGFGLGYRVVVVRFGAHGFGLGPQFRFRHVVAGELRDTEGNPIHQLYVTFGLTLFFTFDLSGNGDDPPTHERGGSSREEDGWESFESVSD